MAEPKTNCSRCGCEILQITANLTGGYCMPCANALAREKRPVTDYVQRRNREPILNHSRPGKEILLSAHYFPGFTPDLTSWTIQVSKDGTIQQEVSWYRRGETEEELLPTATMEPSKLALLKQSLDPCHPEVFGCLDWAACIDDAAMVSLVLPEKNLRFDLPYFHLAHDLDKGYREFSAEERAAMDLFGQIWKQVDRAAPYSLAEHLKR